jgi:hypothetical protein
MALIGSTALTLADWAARYEDDKLASVVELLSQNNEILDDMLWVEGNLPTGNVTTVRTGLPQATWRQLNYGVQPGKSTTAKITESCGMLETYAEIDKALAELNGNTAQFRLSESMAFVEGMTQQMASAVIYSNQASTPQQITGFSPRFNTVSTSTALSASNVIDAGGTGSTNTSIWVVVWGPNTAFGMFPKGSRAGLLHEDLGRWTKTLADGSMLEVYRDWFKWDAGITVRDWRYIVRICNIDVTLLNGGSAANILTLLIRALNRLPTTPRAVASSSGGTSDGRGINGANGRAVIYCNRTVRSALEVQVVNKSNALLAITEYDGIPVTTFRGIPIKTVDAILNTEARVV